MIRAKEIRAKARESMAGKWGRFVGMNALYGLVLVALSLLIYIFPLITLFKVVFLIASGDITERAAAEMITSGLASSGISTILSIVVVLITVPLAYAFIENVMKSKRDNETKATYFLERIFSSFVRAWKVTLWSIVKVFVAYLILIGGMIVVLLLASLIALMGDIAAVLGILIQTAGMVALFMWYISKILGLVLADYIAIDNPDITAKEAVKKSMEYMNGYKWRYICLNLSFIGWAILTIFTLGIGDLFLTPYVNVSMVVFYEEVLKDRGVLATEPVAAAPVEGTPVEQ